MNLDNNSNIVRSQGGFAADIKQPKTEKSPLFKPTKDLEFVNGSPNTLEAQRGRYNESRYNKEVPFNSENVGSGMGLGYDCNPTGGFHQFELQQIERNSIKTVDETRVKTNPKISYCGKTKAGKSSVDQRGKEGKVIVNDRTAAKTVCINTESVDFSPAKGGVQTHQQIIPNFTPKGRGCMKNGSIKSKTSGPAYNNMGSIQQQEISGCNKKILPKTKVTNKTTSTKIHNPNTRSYCILDNNRISTNDANMKGLSNIVSILKALTTPITDSIKQPKRVNTEVNNHNGNITGQKGQTIQNQDCPKTTTKQTTEINKHNGSIKGQTAHTIQNQDCAKTTTRQTTEINKHNGTLSTTNLKPQIYKKDTCPKVTIRNTLSEVDKALNLAGNNRGTIKPQDYARTTTRQTTESLTTGPNNVTTDVNSPTTRLQDCVKNTNRQTTSDNEYIGSANSNNKSPSSQKR